MRLVSALLIAASGALLCAQAPIVFLPAVDTALDGFSRGAYLEANDALATAAFAPNGQVRDPMAFGLWTQFNPLLTNELDLDGRGAQRSRIEAQSLVG